MNLENFPAAQQENFISFIKKVKGIKDSAQFLMEDGLKVIDIEQDAENRSLMGLGRVINTGMKDVLNCDMIFVALTTTEFDWGKHATLVLKKGHDVVGEEVRDKEKIDSLSNRKDVWFMHRNFVVYKDKLQFPHDIMKKICYFEIPAIPADWYDKNKMGFEFQYVAYANPSTLCDVFLKERYFKGTDERGLGTILIGVK